MVLEEAELQPTPGEIIWQAKLPGWAEARDVHFDIVLPFKIEEKRKLNKIRT